MLRALKDNIGLIMIRIGTRISLKETECYETNGIRDYYMDGIMQSVNDHIDRFDIDENIDPISMFHVEAIIESLSNKGFEKQKASAKSYAKSYYKSIWTHKLNKAN